MQVRGFIYTFIIIRNLYFSELLFQSLKFVLLFSYFVGIIKPVVV